MTSRRLPLKIDDLLDNTMKEGCTNNKVNDDDIILAVNALEKLKQDNSNNYNHNHNHTPSRSPSPVITLKPTTIFDKVISHPLISNSINYVLEKTINTSSNNIIINTSSENNDNNNNNIDSANTPCEKNLVDKKISLPPLNSITNKLPSLKRSRDDDDDDGSDVDVHVDDDNTNKPVDPLTVKRIKTANNTTNNNTLRKKVSINSALSAQKSLDDLKQLSTLNLNIESRKKLTMLIQFLKLGNTQLSERIDKLIENVDNKRNKIMSNNITSTSTSSDINIQQIKNEIITTVKKIVNVVSTVSAQSLTEPARSNVRDAILKLPTNWAKMLNNEINEGNDSDSDSNDDNTDDNTDDTDDDDEEEYEDSNENIVNENDDLEDEKIEKIVVNNSTIFKRNRKPSISKRIMDSLIKYRQRQGISIDRNKILVKQWFRKNFKNQIMNDSSGKVLILAQESLDMINKIIKFCNENLDKADNWNSNRQYQHQIELLHKLQNIDKVKDIKEDK